MTVRVVANVTQPLSRIARQQLRATAQPKSHGPYPCSGLRCRLQAVLPTSLLRRALLRRTATPPSREPPKAPLAQRFPPPRELHTIITRRRSSRTTAEMSPRCAAVAPPCLLSSRAGQRVAARPSLRCGVAYPARAPEVDGVPPEDNLRGAAGSLQASGLRGSSGPCRREP